MGFLEALPMELGLDLFCALHSLEDVFSLSATSRSLRRIWLMHIDLIYHTVAPRKIKGEKYARALQLALTRNTKITPMDAANIMHRAHFIESIMNRFDQEVVKHVAATNFRDVYPETSGRHPKQMTATERRRFIRTYYQLWTLMQLDKHQWQSTIDSISIKQIYLLREMCWIPLPIGDDLPGPRMQQRFPLFQFYKSEGRRGELGSTLQQRIEDYVKQKDSWYCDEDPWLVREETRSEGYAGFHLLWDHGKGALKQYCLGRPWQRHIEVSKEDAEFEQKHVWAESSDEEEGV